MAVGAVVRRAPRPRTQDDRIVAIVNPLYLDDRFRSGIADVVARPLAELPFTLELIGIEETFQNNFAERRQWETCESTRDDRNPFVQHRPRIIIFRDARRQRQGAGEQKYR